MLWVLKISNYDKLQTNNECTQVSPRALSCDRPAQEGTSNYDKLKTNNKYAQAGIPTLHNYRAAQDDCQRPAHYLCSGVYWKGTFTVPVQDAGISSS